MSVLAHREDLRIALVLAPGETGWVDRDWIAPGAVLALLRGADARLRWSDAAEDGAADGDPLEPLDVLATWARAALAPVGAAGRVEVRGHGALADLVRQAAPRLPPGVGGPPEALVLTTGDPAAIVAATRELAPGGLLVLAGEPLGRPLEINLYRDVHVRGLRVVGVGRPALGGNGDGGLGALAAPPPPEPARSGARLAPALWYRLTG